jgi:hypothetical protein
MIARIRRFAIAVAALTSAALAAPAAAAQEGRADLVRGDTSAHAVPAGPTIDRAAVGARPLAQRPADDAEAQAALQQRLGLGKARALMIVGFATVIIGLLIGDDVGTLIAIGGAAVGLYGLYNYLR